MSSRSASISSVWAPTAARLGRLYPVNQPEPSRHPLCLSPVSSPYRGHRLLPPKTTAPIADGSVCDLQKDRRINVADISARFLFRTATMVQGPSDAVVHASFPQIDFSLSCALRSGQANCVGEIQQPGMTITTSLRESVKPYLVQGGGSGGGSSSPGPTPAPSQSGSLSSTGKDDSSALMNAVTGARMLVGGVVAGVVVALCLV